MRFGEITTKARIEHDAIVNRYKDVPAELDGMECRGVRDVAEPFFVKGYIVVTKPDMVKNKETGVWEQKTSKKGTPLTIKLAYVECETGDAEFYFVTKSAKMLDQLFQDPERTSEEDGRNGTITVCRMNDPIEDLLKLDFVSVEYHDGKRYTQPILVPAEVSN